MGENTTGVSAAARELAPLHPSPPTTPGSCAPSDSPTPISASPDPAPPPRENPCAPRDGALARFSHEEANSPRGARATGDSTEPGKEEGRRQTSDLQLFFLQMQVLQGEGSMACTCGENHIAGLGYQLLLRVHHPRSPHRSRKQRALWPVHCPCYDPWWRSRPRPGVEVGRSRVQVAGRAGGVILPRSGWVRALRSMSVGRDCSEPVVAAISPLEPPAPAAV